MKQRTKMAERVQKQKLVTCEVGKGTIARREGNNCWTKVTLQ